MKLYNDKRVVAVVGTKHVQAGNSYSLDMIESMDCLEREIFDFPMQKKYDCLYGMMCFTYARFTRANCLDPVRSL
jgi:hypothetical protein